MELRMFRTLWGASGDIDTIAAAAVANGFQGLEGPVPETTEGRTALRAALDRYDLLYIAEITTAGSYVPERRASVDDHLRSLAQRLAWAHELQPQFVSCIGGCDAWPFTASLRFFREAMALAERESLIISFETHRARSLYNPWITADFARAIPQLRFTFDFSHWCVVCERLLDTEIDTLVQLAPQAHHIHARVGYAQGPQVPHPAAPEYAAALHAHQRWWEILWAAMAQRGKQVITMTPEFGPDGYLQELPFARIPVADLGEINGWMADTERLHFSLWTEAHALRSA